MRYDERPIDATPRHTDELPPTPVRDRTSRRRRGIEAPESLRLLGDDLPGQPVAEHKRRIGPWLLWRASPASGRDARYWAGLADDPATATRCTCIPTAEPPAPALARVPHPLPRVEEDLRDAR